MTNKIGYSSSSSTDQPKFDRSHETVSVVVGKRALLPCYVSIQDANNNGHSPFKVIIFIRMKKILPF